MGKIAVWILVVVAVMLILRLIATHKRRVDDATRDAAPAGTDKSGVGGRANGRNAERDSERDAERGGNRGELMMSCDVCGIHIPSSDALFARGKVFCGPEHRDLGDR